MTAFILALTATLLSPDDPVNVTTRYLGGTNFHINASGHEDTRSTTFREWMVAELVFNETSARRMLPWLERWKAGGRPPPGVRALSELDIAAVRASTQEYCDAWLANDANRVMRTLTSDAVLLPSGLAVIAGERDIRGFWWPANGPRTTVASMDLQVDGIVGDGTVAVVRGRGKLSYRTEPNPQMNTIESWFLNVVVRQADGRWLIAQRAWSDRRPVGH
jgi:uncharacterized protein (TIGR02246 family)